MLIQKNVFFEKVTLWTTNPVTAHFYDNLAKPYALFGGGPPILKTPHRTSDLHSSHPAFPGESAIAASAREYIFFQGIHI